MSDAWSVFDIIGPVMVGPSSSHTAGACKLGYFAQKIHGVPPKKVAIELHGSFAEVGEGHSTDAAIIGGLLGFPPSDARISESFDLAEKAGLEFSFSTEDLGSDRHPNSVRFSFDDKVSPKIITGSSLGGGRAEIVEIDKIPVSIDGSYSCLFLAFEPQDGFFNHLLSKISQENLNIIRTDTQDYKDRSILVLEMREFEFSEEKRKDLESIPGVLWARFLPHISHYQEA